MARELMQARHELEASRRVQAEYAERTHAAEKKAARAKERSQQAHAAYDDLRVQHEQLKEEAQSQRNRVATLRLTVRRLQEDKGGVSGGEAASTVGGSGTLSPTAATSPKKLEERPAWNSDVVLYRKDGAPAPVPRDEQGRVPLTLPGHVSASGGGAHHEILEAGGATAHLLHLRPPPLEGFTTSVASTVGGGGGTEMIAAEGRASGDVASMQYQLRAMRGEKVAAERAAEERQAQCEKLQALVAEADARRDEQVEAAAGASAEASTLRRQLQLQLEKIDELHRERRKVQEASASAVARAMEEARLEMDVRQRSLGGELRALEKLCASLANQLRPPPTQMSVRLDRRPASSAGDGGPGGVGLTNSASASRRTPAARPLRQ